MFCGQISLMQIVRTFGLACGLLLIAGTHPSFSQQDEGLPARPAAVNDSTTSNRTGVVEQPASKSAAESKPVPKPLPPSMPDVGEIPDGRVLISCAPGLSAADRWLLESENWPQEEMRFEQDQFLLPRLPKRYDEWGILDDWKSPLLLRVAADVDFPPGKRRLLLRARGLGRVWIDGNLVAETKANTQKPPDGEQDVTPIAEPPKPGLRAHGYRMQEVFGEFEVHEPDSSSLAACRVVLELIVGGPNQRTECGEVCVAMEAEDGSTYHLVAPRAEHQITLTDAQVEPALARIEQQLQTQDDANRRKAAASQAAFWKKRHTFAANWIAEKRSRSAGRVQPTAEQHPIDFWIQEKIAAAVKSTAESGDRSSDFHDNVLPILRQNCFRCHGEKAKGSLKLNSRAAMLLAGDSGQPAVVPGKPEDSELMALIRSGEMPPAESKLTADQIDRIEKWIQAGAEWPERPVSADQVQLAPVIDDFAFLRRVYLDTVGVPPTPEEARRFLQSSEQDKRIHLIDELLADERLSDHWISYWQDVLAENPTLVNQSLGSTGPFRWFLQDSLRDHKPFDRTVTELLLMRGNAGTGGSAAFGISGESDSPMAAKAHVLASAFLGIDLQCARCHDSPFHKTTQRDLYSLAAMLERKAVKVPPTSRVPAAFFEKKGRESQIEATLKPDEIVEPVWPFEVDTDVVDRDNLDELVIDPTDSRQRLAMLITAPMNERFAKVIANRVWKRLMGAGIIEPVYDWEGKQASHPELLNWLADEFVSHQYEFRHLIRCVMTSQAYARDPRGNNLTAEAGQRFFNAPDRRRLSAEQVVDSLFAVTGCRMDTEVLTFVHDGQRPLSSRQSLGRPTRAWMFASLNNERDRPSLALPGAQAVVDVLEAFGWKGNRQQPINSREQESNLLQPGILANGVLTTNLTRAAYGSTMSRLALSAKKPEELVDEWYQRILTRKPSPEEKTAFVNALSIGFDERIVEINPAEIPQRPAALPLVTWFNHLRPETTTIQLENEKRVRQGPPVDPRLREDWRQIYEDFVWSLVNHRDFVWMP